MNITEELKVKKLLTRDETAAHLGICLTSLDKITRKPDFPALVRIGHNRGRVFINREKLYAWIDAQTGK